MSQADFSIKKFNFRQNVFEDKHIKFGENSNSCCIIASGNKGSVGTITSSNSNLHTLLGYQKNEIIGQNVDILMPKIIA